MLTLVSSLLTADVCVLRFDDERQLVCQNLLTFPSINLQDKQLSTSLCFQGRRCHCPYHHRQVASSDEHPQGHSPLILNCSQLVLPLWKQILFIFVFIIVFCFVFKTRSYVNQADFTQILLPLLPKCQGYSGAPSSQLNNII